MRQIRDLGALLPALAAAGEGIGAADADYRRSDDPLPDLQADNVDVVKVLPVFCLPPRKALLFSRVSPVTHGIEPH